MIFGVEEAMAGRLLQTFIALRYFPLSAMINNRVIQVKNEGALEISGTTDCLCTKARSTWAFSMTRAKALKSAYGTSNHA